MEFDESSFDSTDDLVVPVTKVITMTTANEKSLRSSGFFVPTSNASDPLQVGALHVPLSGGKTGVVKIKKEPVSVLLRSCFA